MSQEDRVREYRAKAAEFAREAAQTKDERMARVLRSGERSYNEVADRAEGKRR